MIDTLRRLFEDEELLRDVAPFLAAIVFVLLGPVFVDDITWKQRYREYYKIHGEGDLSEDNLTTSAAWAVDQAQVFPGCVLAWLGAILVIPKVGTLVALISILIPIIPIAAANISGKKQNLHDTRNLFWHYTAMQFLVIAINFVSLGLVVLSSLSNAA